MGAWLRKLGAPASEIEDLRNASMPARQFVEFAKPDVLLEDGDKPDMPGWDLTAVWTPGHSPGHLCFWEPANQLMLTGDCVLPRITPNVNLNPQTGDDPLGDYLRSLERLGTYDGEGLPAHEWRFASLRERHARVAGAPRAAIPRSHRTRSATAHAPRGRSRPAWTWSRPWDQLDRFTRRSAIGEALAHLRTLEVQRRRARGLRRTVALGAATN